MVFANEVRRARGNANLGIRAVEFKQIFTKSRPYITSYTRHYIKLVCTNIKDIDSVESKLSKSRNLI